MNYLHALLLGALQGLTELLPISSSAHLALAPKFFNWVEQGLAFDVALHWGSLLAILFYFRNDWLKLLRSLKTRGHSDEEIQFRYVLWLLVLATIPGALAGLLLDNYISDHLRSPSLIAVNLAVFGVILYLADRLGRKKRPASSMSFVGAVFVGLAQALALVPGVSRSGATITAGLALGLTRVEAARFSFLLSAPIIFGAGLVALPDLNWQLWPQAILGFVASAAFSWLAIKLLLSYVKQYSFLPFMIYRLLLAGLVWYLLI